MITAKEYIEKQGIEPAVDFEGNQYVQIEADGSLSAPIPRNMDRITANQLAREAIEAGLETYRHPDGTPEVVFNLDFNEKKCWIEPYWPAKSNGNNEGA